MKDTSDVKIIGYGLALIYGLGLFIYLAALLISFFDPDAVLRSPLGAGRFSDIKTFQSYAYSLWILYFPQFIAFLAVARLKEWGRKPVIVINGILILQVLYKVFQMREIDFLSWTSVLIYLLIILYFSQSKIKAKFQGGRSMDQKRILVVDDDKTLLKWIKSMLADNGYEVFTTDTGEKGIELAFKKKPHLIVLDVILPGVKGREVCGRLKENHETRDIPVIFLTAKDSPDDVRAEIEAGGLCHITKPVDGRMLLAEIKRIIGS
jgi:CheY-like chemotaxis protein